MTQLPDHLGFRPSEFYKELSLSIDHHIENDIDMLKRDLLTVWFLLYYYITIDAYHDCNWTYDFEEGSLKA